MSEPPPGSRLQRAAAVVIPLDGDDTRGRHFRELIGHPRTLIVAASGAIAAFVLLAATVSAAAGGLAVVAVVLLTLVAVFAIASARAQGDFFRAYAEGRGLAWNDGRSPAPPLTRLLRNGDERYLVRTFRGRLPGGLDGTLAHYTYEVHSTDGKGRRQTSAYAFTVAIADLPELAPYLRELAVQERVGFRFLDAAEDRFRKRRRVELESERADRRYEVFIGEHDDMNRARQVLAPTFIVWLAESAPKSFAFELAAGALVCAVRGHAKSAGRLDAVCEAAAVVARRLADEARE